MRIRRRQVLTAVIVVAAQAAAVLVYLRVQRSRTPAAPEGWFAMERLGVPTPAPDVAMTNSDGEPRKLSSWRGRRVVLHVWATWCAPCRKELPDLLRLAPVLGEERIELVALSVDGDWEDIRAFFSSSVPAAVYRATDADYKRLGARLLPTTFVLDEDGNVRLRMQGARDWGSSAARDALRSAL